MASIVASVTLASSGMELSVKLTALARIILTELTMDQSVATVILAITGPSAIVNLIAQQLSIRRELVLQLLATVTLVSFGTLPSPMSTEL